MRIVKHFLTIALLLLLLSIMIVVKYPVIGEKLSLILSLFSSFLLIISIFRLKKVSKL